jgi:hypothetical protein
MFLFPDTLVLGIWDFISSPYSTTFSNPGFFVATFLPLHRAEAGHGDSG